MKCAAHPATETELTCATCGKPICPGCLVQTYPYPLLLILLGLVVGAVRGRCGVQRLLTTALSPPARLPGASGPVSNGYCKIAPREE
jgi:hypothetical protein